MPAMFHLTGNRSSAAMPRRHSSPDTVNTAPVVYDAAGDEPEDRVGDLSGQAARPYGNSRGHLRRTIRIAAGGVDLPMEARPH